MHTTKAPYRHLRRRGLGCAAFALLLAAGTSFAQGTRADYERAANLHRLAENTVFRDRVRPTWIGGNARFWYRVRTGRDTYEFVLVDAEKGVRGPAFDHARLAAALAEQGIGDARADRLPIERPDFALPEERFEFRSGGAWWRCDLRTYELARIERRVTPAAQPPVRDLPRASRRTGPETSIIFVNKTQGGVELFWLDADGERRSYGTLKPGEERDQHTYAGHVWLAVDGTGAVLAGFEAD
jgi:dipeptidyl-peptidase 4